MKKQDVVTLADSHVYNREHWEKGVNCLSCGQLVKLYKRKFNSGMARILIHIYAIHKTKPDNDKWIKITEEVLARGVNPATMEYSKLKHWGLIEPRGDAGENTPSAGYWKLTQRGENFVTGKATIPSHVNLFNDRIVGFSENHITIQKALGNHFNYDELMSEI